MTPLRQWQVGFTVLARHLRNAGTRPDRWYWIIMRIGRILREGRLGAVLERHAIVDDLYAEYPKWLDRFDPADNGHRAALRASVDRMVIRPLISVLLPTYQSALPDLAAAVASVRGQVYPDWELVITDDGSTDAGLRAYLLALKSDPRIRLVLRDTNGGIAACLNSALADARGAYVAFLDHDDMLHAGALLRVAEAIAANPEAQLLYTDEDMIDRAGTRHHPHFKPDWNEEWIRTTNYVLHMCVAKTADARAIGGMRAGIDGVQDWDFVLRLSERAGRDRIVHVPRVLYHWRVAPGSTAAGVHHKPGIESAQKQVLTDMLARRGISAAVEHDVGGWRIRYSPPSPPPLVSIVIPTRDAADVLRQCIESIRTNTAYPTYEIVLVDHASTEPEAVALLAHLGAQPGVRVVAFDGAFNYAALCNLGVRCATGSFVVLLNNDVEVIESDWLERLVGHAAQPGVGVVGALLLYPDGTIQHAGVMLGLNGTADRPYLGYRRGHAGVVGRACAAQDISAVVTACVAMRRSVYDEIGGMDESFAVSHNDLDLCLRVRERGYRNVWTAAVALVHHEGVSRGMENSPADRVRADDEATRFRTRWAGVIDCDPCYNPNLTRVGTAFGLAFPPRLPAGQPVRERAVHPFAAEPEFPNFHDPTTTMNDFSAGCRMNAREWAEFNRSIVFERTELGHFAAPFPPRDLMQNVSGLEVERDFAAHGAHFWDVFSAILPRPMAEYDRILDFGCGCGRLARLFKGHPGEVCGCDIDARHVEWIRGQLPFVDATLTRPNQNLPYGNNGFDLVISISVFTHLNEASQDLMLGELCRVTRPGGTLLLTTHGERALARACNEERIYQMLAVDAAGFAEAGRRFDAGDSAFIAQQGHLTSSEFQYGITFLPAPYVNRHWGAYFDVERIVSGAIHDFQDVVVLRKRS